MKYGWKYYFESTPQNVGKWLLGIEGVLVGVGSSAFLLEQKELAFYILLATGILNKLGNFFAQTNEDQNGK
jgi:hypothetical protein